MNRKYYNCYSLGLMKFLAENNIHPVKKLMHDRTKNTIYVYRLDNKLSKLLTKWTNRGKDRNMVAV